MRIQVTSTWSAAGCGETEGVLRLVLYGIRIKKFENHFKTRELEEIKQYMKSLYYMI